MKHISLKDKLAVVDRLSGDDICRCDDCLKDVMKHPECDGWLNPIKTFLKDDSLAGLRARKLIKKHNGNDRLCGKCFFGGK